MYLEGYKEHPEVAYTEAACRLRAEGKQEEDKPRAEQEYMVVEDMQLDLEGMQSTAMELDKLRVVAGQKGMLQEVVVQNKAVRPVGSMVGLMEHC